MLYANGVKTLLSSNKYKAVEQSISSLQCPNTWLLWRSNYTVAYTSVKRDPYVGTKTAQTSMQPCIQTVLKFMMWNICTTKDTQKEF